MLSQGIKVRCKSSRSVNVFLPFLCLFLSPDVASQFSTYSEATILLLTTVLSAEVCDVCGGAKESLAVPGQSVAD